MHLQHYEERPAFDNSKVKLYVYGTLKRGQGNHGYLKNASILGTCRLEDHIMVSLGGCPGICEAYGFRVWGEVYALSWDDILDIDGLEGHPDFYQRVQVDIPIFGKVWTYRLPGKYVADDCKAINGWIKNGHWDRAAAVLPWKGLTDAYDNMEAGMATRILPITGYRPKDVVTGFPSLPPIDVKAMEVPNIVMEIKEAYLGPGVEEI